MAAKLPSSKVVPAQMVLNSKAKDRKFKCDFQYSQKTESPATFYIWIYQVPWQQLIPVRYDVMFSQEMLRAKLLLTRFTLPTLYS